MRQIALNIIERLAYRGESFYLHQGVKIEFQRCLTELRSNIPVCLYLAGSGRSGKTHFTIAAHDMLINTGIQVELVEGSDFAALMRSELKSKVLIVDDADYYLGQIKSGESGPFVSFMERTRKFGASVLLTGRTDFFDFTFDDHIRSRLASGAALRIGQPAEEDMAELIRLIARQRGIELGERKISYLVKRTGREIAAIEEALAEKGTDEISHCS